MLRPFGSFRSFLLLLISAFALAGCIVVDDFGEYWDKGFIDHCVNDIMNSGESSRSGKPRKTLLMRSLRVGNHTFLMVRERASEAGGNLMLYEIEDGQFVSYRLNESKREDFLRDYPDSGVVLTSETAAIPKLTPESVELLDRVADDASYWMESRRERYNPARKKDCIQTLY